MNQFLTTLRNLGPVRLAAMGGVAILLFGFFLYVMTRLSSPEMALLYDQLDTRDSAAVVEQLEARNVPFELRADGASILVPADQVDRMRLAMAQEGIPNGGGLGYELFDNSDGFGTTTFVQNINRLRALEGELARTIATVNDVRQARVHLVLPERALFSRDQQEPTASVFLRLDAGGLTPQQVVAIQHLVSFAVPGLEPAQVSIVDDTGMLLAASTDASDPLAAQSNALEHRRAEESRLAQQIEQMLTRSLGPGRVIARVAIEMDFDRVETTSESYDPDSQVARSTQFVEQEDTSSEGNGLDPVTIAGNLPEAENLGGGPGGFGVSNQSSRTEETTNFEISRTVENRVREGGSIDRLSVAVMVDGTYGEGADGALEYTPRTDAELAQITALVQSTVGFDAIRGDIVEVVNMRFLLPDELEPLAATTTFFGFQTEDLMRLLELLILGVVAALVILLVVRPLLSRALEPGGHPALAGIDSRDDLTALLTDQSSFQNALAGPGAPMPIGGMPELPSPDEPEETEVEHLIDIQQVEGRVRASSIKKIGEIVDNHPEEAVSIIRNWMYQDT